MTLFTQYLHPCHTYVYGHPKIFTHLSLYLCPSLYISLCLCLFLSFRMSSHIKICREELNPWTKFVSYKMYVFPPFSNNNNDNDNNNNDKCMLPSSVASFSMGHPLSSYFCIDGRNSRKLSFLFLNFCFQFPSLSWANHYRYIVKCGLWGDHAATT